MKKPNKSKRRRKKSRDRLKPGRSSIARNQRNVAVGSIGSLGLYSREYPPQSVRHKVIAQVEKTLEDTRTSDDWWMLGEYKILDGILDENESLINEGTQALMRGADHESPSVACMADLAWVQIWKNLDSFALPYLEKAVQLVPDSRDIWLLKGIAHIGLGQRSEAATSLEKAVSSHVSQKLEADLLNSVNEGKALDELRASHVFNKIDPFDPRNIYQYQKKESIKWEIFQLKECLKNNPSNSFGLIALAHCRYLLEEFDQAYSLYNEALSLELDPSSAADCYCALGLISRKSRSKNSDDAEEVSFYEEALNVHPDHLLSLVNLAGCLQGQNKYDEARILHERIFRHDLEDSYHYHIALGNFGNYVGVVEKDFAREAELQLEAIKYCPDGENNALVLHKLNAIRSLLTSNQIQLAKELWSKWKSQVGHPKQFDINREAISSIEMLLEIFVNRRWVHPVCDLGHIEMLTKHGATNAELRPVIERCWLKRDQLLNQNLLNRSVLHIFGENNADEIFDLSSLKNLTGDELEKQKDLCRGGFFEDIGLIASNAGMHQYALDIWEAGSKLSIEEEYGTVFFTQNMVTELKNLDRNKDALTLAEAMPKPNGLRGWTILGNARMGNGLYKAAIDAYKSALVSDSKFLLPYSNAIECAYQSKEPSDLDDFREHLESDWIEDTQAQLILADLYLLQGSPSKSRAIYSKLLEAGDGILNPEELYEKFSDPTDLTIRSSPSLSYHRRYATALLRSASYLELEKLIIAVSGWPKWMDGDWRVLYAESLRRRGLFNGSIESLDGMDDPPPHLTRSLCFIEQNDYKNATVHLNHALNNSNLGQYNHPEGSPDSVAHAIQSWLANEELDFEKAARLGRESVVLDPGCALARLVVAHAQASQGDVDGAITDLIEGMHRIPGQPRLVEQALKHLVELERYDQADEILSKQRPLLIEHNAEQLGFELGEFLALARQQALSEVDPKKAYTQMKLDWPWVEQLDERSQHWLHAAFVFKNQDQLFLSALAVYLGKLCEHLLNKNIMAPFKSIVDANSVQLSERFSDVSKYLAGDFPPSINGVVRLLQAAAKEATDTDEQLVTEFRKFLLSYDEETHQLLTDKKFIRRLNRFGHLRNEAAHAGEPDYEKFNQRISVVLEDWKPGPLLNAFGIH